MNIALLGYGKEGQAAEKYFKSKDQGITFEIFQNFTYGSTKTTPIIILMKL